MSVDWELKLKTFLYRAPWGALCDRSPEGGKLVREFWGNDDLKVVKEAHALATALSGSRFLDEGDWGVWKQNPTLIHPLAGKDFPVKEIVRSVESREIEEEVKKALDQLWSLMPGNPSSEDFKKLFLAIWRLLPDPGWNGLKGLPPGIREIWGLLPADPRVPDHSIWDLASAASALAGTYDPGDGKFKPALLLFTVASAQGFLAEARRTQDLWMGSYLLSYLIWQAMRPIVDKVGPDAVLSPDLHGQPLVDRWLLYDIGLEHALIEQRAKDHDRIRIANLPSFFTAIVPRDRAEGLAKKAVESVRNAKRGIADAVQEHVADALKKEEKLNSLVGDALREIGPKDYREKIAKKFNESLRDLDRDGDWKDIWKRQIEDFLEPRIFWVVLPWDALGGDLDEIKEKFGELGDIPENLSRLYEVLKEKGCMPGENAISIAYPLLSSLAGRLITTRKNLRHFAQVKEPGHKCTQCGVREALHIGIVREVFVEEVVEKGDKKIPDMDPYPEVRAFWEVLRRVGEGGGDKPKLAGRIRRGDRLCAVCLTKRLAWEAFFLKKGPKEGGFSEVMEELKERLPAHLLFPSTASIATAGFKERVLEKLKKEGSEDLWKKLKTYVEKMRELAELIYPSAELPKLERLAETTAESLEGDTEEIRKILLGGREVEETGFLRLDGDWLFPESFDEKAVEREYGIEVSEELKEKLKQAREALRELLEAAKAKGILAPRRYLAILAMDGDRMGKWLTGQLGPTWEKLFHSQLRNKVPEKLRGKIRPLCPVRQRALSHALKDFALEVVRPVVEEAHCGRLIYAGGDDVLALLPPEELAGVLHDLQALFGGIPLDGNEEECPSVFDLGEGREVELGVFAKLTEKDGERLLLLPGCRTLEGPEGLTLSAGVAMVHCTHPLWHAVEEAFKAMKRAKREPQEDAEEDDVEKGWGRDAWTVTVLKRSGEPRTSGGKWFYGDLDVWCNIKKLIGLFTEGLSPRFIYQMQSIATGMAAFKAQEEALERTLRLLLERREGLTKEDDVKTLLRIPSWFRNVRPEKAVGDPWAQLLEWFRLVRFLAKEERG